MKNNISCVNLCTGCSTCLNICPHKAIKIKINQEGFYSPEVDERICTDCGLCLKKCPLYNANYNNFDNPTCYAAYATDNFRCGSSSGGVFPIIAKYVIDQKGIVCGAAWTEENTVKHIIIDQTSDIIKLQGSKYLQSYIGDTYRQIKQFLKMDKLVLFSGTPCQVAGLKSFLSFDYRNLITIEVICHGVPSVSIYKKYIKELISSEDEVVISTNFRDKINGWNPYLTTTTTTKGNYSFPAVSDTFLLAFLKNLSLSKACGSCIYAKVPRQADITLGDFWRIDEYDKSLNDGKGTSVILVNSPKGSFVLDRIKNNLKLLRKVPISYAIKGNPNIVRPVMLHKERDNFFLRMDQYTLQDNLDLSLGKKYDCAILNLWHTNNFGALLTCYALQEIIKKIGKVPRVINYLPGDWQYRFHNNISEEFSAKYLELTSLCKNKLDLIKLNRETNSFIVGSDQVWRYKYIKNYGSDVYALSFAASNANKISYAASFGISSFEANDEEINNFNFYLNRFNSISVRENDGVKLCKSTFNVNATQVLDPVFLLETYYWDNMIFNDVERKRKKYSLVSYVLDQNDNSEQLISDLELVIFIIF